MRALINRYNPHLFAALALAIAFHGGLLLSGTFRGTYDAYVHLFFADHYARSWFDHWEPRWYTGFPMTGYPPGSHQATALLSMLVGLPTAFVIVTTFAVLNCTLGIYRFSKLWVSDEAAGYAALLLVFGSSIAETVHVFGQLPTMFSLGFLLNTVPFVYLWIREGKLKHLFTAWALNAATTAGHHVTTLFGAVFFVGPVIVLALVESLREARDDEPSGHVPKINRVNFWPLVFRRLRRIWPSFARTLVYVPGLIVALVFVVLPYWLWSKNDPITQVSIPHSSRDSFIENTSAGFMFWIVPYGATLLLIPYVFYKGFASRAWPMALSYTLLFVLGTGGTTPIPRLILRHAFDILTLDRFTFWASITQLPLLGQFVASLRGGRLARFVREQAGDLTWRLSQSSLLIGYLIVAIFVSNLTKYRSFQPAPIEVKPIVTFLEKDQHWRWRFLTLGFGDQMAWLSSQTTACSVDGNYHSARRLPEMTTTPVERLEGAKFSGIPGIGSLQQFLAVPDKYNLKFVFSNDQFYDPLLFFSGWHRLQRLENGIMVWEREDIPPMPEVLPRKEIPYYQRVMWGVVPPSALVVASIIFAAPVWWPYLLWAFDLKAGGISVGYGIRRLFWSPLVAPLLTLRRLLLKVYKRVPLGSWLYAPYRHIDNWMLTRSQLPAAKDGARVSWQVWLEWFAKLPRPKPATAAAHHVRLTGLVVVLGLASAWLVRSYVRETRTPETVVQGYYDDLDFRRFVAAHARLDPRTRPDFDQYLLELSVKGGLVASYGKLDSLKLEVLERTDTRLRFLATTNLITSVSSYLAVEELELEKFKDSWYILPTPNDIKTPPSQFLRRAEVGWVSAGRRRVTTKTTAFSDVLDRPELQLLSARMVFANGRHSVVGELINIDSDPADVTVTSYLRDDDQNELSRYNAQYVMMHKILPKEVTPFRVDFEGVAGSKISQPLNVQKFDPVAFTDPEMTNAVTSFDVFAKAVVTSHDLLRALGVQNLLVSKGADDLTYVSGELLNTGTHEATIPHLLFTYYDDSDRVAWVDHFYLRDAVRPQRTQAFSFPITPASSVDLMIDKGDLFTNNLSAEVEYDSNWPERIRLPASSGYAALRVSVNYFTGVAQ